jgi:hypothetical protein
MNHVILAPPVKTDTVTCLAIANWLESRNELVTIIAKSTHSKFFDELSISYYTDIQIAKGLELSGELTLYCLHATNYYTYFKGILMHLVSNSKIKSISLCFMPEGFGNAMWGERFTDRLALEPFDLSKVRLTQTISYGFKQYYIEKKFPDAKKIVLNYSTVVRAINSSGALTKLTSKALDQLKPKFDILFIPFRPWCTDSFHKGMYSFGDSDTLSRITINMLLDSGISGQDRIYFRPDIRFSPESDYLLQKLNERFSSIQIDSEIYPEWLSLEPLFNSLLNHSEVFSITILNYDSTTAIPAIFLAAESKIRRFRAIFGCKRKLLEDTEGGIEFYNRKLKPKITMFREHLAPLRFPGCNYEIISTEPGYMEVLLSKQ